MAEKNSNIQVSFGIQGMERASFAHLLNEKVFTFSRNSNIETDSESIALTNEHSNLLCSRFKPDYVVIGVKYDTLNSKIFFFITEKDANSEGKRNSEIGFIKINGNITDESDLDLDCGCDMKSILAKPLENTTQIPYCTYTTLIEDSCNHCLNFDPNYPIYNIILKQESCGYTMSFASKNNPYRYIIMDKIDYYTYKGDINCGEDNTESTCIDCEKLRVFPFYEQPYIHPEVINYGGNLKRGTYEFYVAYCDKLGNELTSYISATNIIPIFDPTNIQLNQTNRFSESTYAIKLKVDNLDKKFNFYKVAVIERTDVTEVTSAFEEGIHSITDTNVIYTSNGTNNGKRISLNKLFLEKPVYKNFGGIVASNGMLFGYDYELEKEWNLQPIVNLMGSFVKWQTVEATEDLYKDGVNVAMYKGYMRDEVYPLSIGFTTTDGYKTSKFPFIARSPKDSEKQIYTKNYNKDVSSILENSPQCSTQDRKYKWQFYNTAEVLGNSYSDQNIENAKIISKIVEEDCIQENVKELINGSFEINIDSTFYNLQDWTIDHKDELCDIDSEYYNEALCNLLTDNVLIECDHSDIFTFPIEDDCQKEDCSGTCNDVEKSDSELYISDLENIKLKYTEKRYPWLPGNTPAYTHNFSSNQCMSDMPFPHVTINNVGFYNQSNDKVAENDIIIWGGVTSLNDTPNMAENTNCSQAITLPAISQSITSQVVGNIVITDILCSDPLKTFILFNSKTDINFYPEAPVDYIFSKDSLLTDIDGPIISGFENKILTTALWYTLEFPNNDTILFEITPVKKNSKCTKDTSTGDDMVRYTIFDKCKNGNILKSGLYNAKDGLFLELNKLDFGKKQIFISLDTKLITNIKTHIGLAGTECLRRYADSFYISSSICGCFDVVIRPKEYYKIDITYDRISVDKKTKYLANCLFHAPGNENCGVIPHKYGMFSYWESQEKYPDNSDLYNSSGIKLNISKLDHEDIELIDIFSNNYINSQSSDSIAIWKKNGSKSSVDFTCEPIRHFKFPDNSVIPFMTTSPLLDFGASKIYPIGLTIDEKTINVFLDSAVDSGLIDQEQRNRINGYEIFRGDRTVDKSIIMKGILNDMYKDPRDSNSNQNTYFRNFPYNSLGKNQFVTEDSERKTLISHPFSSTKNDRFSFISPEIYYSRPKSPFEMSIDGYMYGNSISRYIDVEDHSEWVILGDKAYALAKKLALAEVLMEGALNLATLTIESSKNYWFTFSLGAGGNPIGTGVSIAATAIYLASEILNLTTYKLPKLTTQWLETFENRSSVNNFGSMYVSQKGLYNYFKPNKDKGDMLRGLVTSKYLSNGVDVTTEIQGNTASITAINNKDREDSIYLYTGSEYPINYPQEYIGYDNTDISGRNSSRYISSQNGCNDITSTKRIASPYVSLKNYIPSQYGKIDEIKWISLNHNSRFSDESKNIFGGDIYISRVDLKNKVKLFNKSAVGLANKVPFKYSKGSNIGYTKFYVDYKSSDEVIGTSDMPYLSSKYNLDCRPSQSKFYEGDPSKFYLYAYGIPYFLTESEINSNYRYSGTEYHEQFASRGLNIEDWVQEKNVSIANNNLFYYNNVYSRQQTGLSYRILPSYYDRVKWDCLADAENGVAWSEPDNSEVSLSDPWLVFKPFNIYRFPFSFGKLISLNAIESTQVMGRFSDNMAIFNAIDVLRDRITPENEDVGTGGVFAQRPVQFSFTDLGETGSQSKSMVSNEFGHFWVDAKRGKVFQLEPNAKGLNAISDFKAKGDESGMRKWFKRHLPFKILKSGINNLTENNLDNPYKSLGILMWWDSRFKRVFITKKDYIPLNKCIEFNNGDFYLNQTKCSGIPQTITCPEGYTYNESTNKCEKIIITPLCNDGYLYNQATQLCERIETIDSIQKENIVTTKSCPEGYNLINDICVKTIYSDKICPIGSSLNQLGTCSTFVDKPSDIIFIKDRSGSVDSSESIQLSNFMKGIVDGLSSKLNTGDFRIGNIMFDDTATIGNQLSSDINSIKNGISSDTTIGGTNIASGMCLAKTMLTDNTRNKLIIVFIDGVQNTGESCLNISPEFAQQDAQMIAVARSFEANDNIKIGMVYVGSEAASIESKYILISGDKFPSVGTGVQGRFAYRADTFAELQNVVTNVVFEINKPNEIIQNMICVQGYNNYSSTQCSKTLTQNPIINTNITVEYTCDIGYNLNNTSKKCEKIITKQSCNGCEHIGLVCNCKKEVTPTFSNSIKKVELTDPLYFKDVSWTVAYSPMYQSWISYYDFKPDYAIGLNDYFYTGLNYSKDSKEVGIWSHLLTNKSYQVFYGKLYPWEIEIPIKNTYTNNVLQDLKIWTISQRFHDNYDYAVWRKKSFNKIIIYNQTNNSGILNLDYNDSMSKSKYPKVIDQLNQGIQASHTEEALNINYFYNRVRREENHLPVWNSDLNEIQKELNPNVISFNSKKVLERLRGDWFLVKMIQDRDSRFKHYFKWMISKEQGY